MTDKFTSHSLISIEGGSVGNARHCFHSQTSDDACALAFTHTLTSKYTVKTDKFTRFFFKINSKNYPKYPRKLKFQLWANFIIFEFFSGVSKFKEAFLCAAI